MDGISKFSWEYRLDFIYPKSYRKIGIWQSLSSVTCISVYLRSLKNNAKTKITSPWTPNSLPWCSLIADGRAMAMAIQCSQRALLPLHHGDFCRHRHGHQRIPSTLLPIKNAHLRPHPCTSLLLHKCGWQSQPTHPKTLTASITINSLKQIFNAILIAL